MLFALGRLPGWIAQWREMIEDPATRIGRPRQVYTGPTERELPRALHATAGELGLIGLAFPEEVAEAADRRAPHR